MEDEGGHRVQRGVFLLLQNGRNLNERENSDIIAKNDSRSNVPHSHRVHASSGVWPDWVTDFTAHGLPISLPLSLTPS